MPKGQLTLPLGPIRNSNLFSNHWLEHRLPLEPEWREFRDKAVRILDSLGELWKQQQHRVEQCAEHGLEIVFIGPVLSALGWKADYQPPLRGRTPDYALFLDDESLDAAFEVGRGSEGFWQRAVLVGDAKAWTANLDRPTKIDGKREYPPEQIERYIHRSARDYGVLTTGRLWRLYPQELAPHQPRFETYLECDLAAILETWTGSAGGNKQRTLEDHARLIDEFLRFYLFFSPVAFRAVEDRTPLIQRAAIGSNEYRLGVGEGLKGRVFEALRVCMEGFLGHTPNKLDGGRDLPLVKEQSLILLYRLLFVMYGEDRGLLPYRTNRTYRDNRSLSRLRDQVAGQLDRLDFGTAQDFGRTTCDLWEDLNSLFDLIDRGGKRFGVPAYNGGLFDPEESAFLNDNALPDWYAARVIDQLGRAPDLEHPKAGLFRVDYRDLSIQHLGHVYEGLLELGPVQATEPMVAVRRITRHKVEEKVVPLSRGIPRGYEEIERIGVGDIYLATDKGERRATGSYYTPNHIVDYIVERTLGPLCRQIGESLTAEIEATEQEAKRRRGRNRELLQERLDRLQADFDDRILQLKVLDPAMGSGHFLLRACQYLAEEIATNPNTGDPRTEHLEGDESVLTYWKRRVVEQCLHGVDMNPLAVELAKVALWLETASRNEPLTFLDHHLRCGNSLVGGWVADLGALPGAPPMPLFEQQAASRLPILLDGLKQISDIPSETADQVKKKTRLYRQAVDKVRRPLVAVADLWCATFYLTDADQMNPDQYADALQTLGSPGKHRKVAREPWFRRAVATAHRPDVACFHWELEFPEVFFDKSGRREEAGFDAVVGNPPYDVLSEKETGHDLAALRKYLKARPGYEPSFRGKNNLYKLFVCLALSLLRDGGRMGFITPMAVLGDDQAADLRKEILRGGAFTSVDGFPQKDDSRRRVFPEAKLSTAVFTLVKTDDERLKAEAFVSRVHRARQIEGASPSLKLSTAEIPLYDPSNRAVVTCSQQDWDLAVRLTKTGRMWRMPDVCTSFQGEVNETTDGNKGYISDLATAGPLILRGSNVCLYVIREASQGSPLYLRVSEYFDRKSPGSKAFHSHERRVGFQRSSPQNNFRRIVACLLPKDSHCFDTVSYVPESESKWPLEVILGLLDSKLLDWYFRLGSTNSKVNEYQFNNLPCPAFAGDRTAPDNQVRDAALAAIRKGDMGKAFDVLAPGLAEPPFSAAVRDTIVGLVRRIILAEEARGEISRTERSRLSDAAQPYQHLIDRLMYAMAGLTDAEARGLEERLARML